MKDVFRPVSVKMFLVWAGAVLALGTTPPALPAFATTVRPVELTCPVCGQKISALVIMSTNTFGGQDSDLLSRARGTQPIVIFPIVCTKCYYAGYEDDFEKDVKLSEEQKEKLRKTLKPPVEIKNTGKSMEVPAWARYDLAAQTYSITGQSPEAIAATYHRASWAVRLTAEPLPEWSQGVQEKIEKALSAAKEEADQWEPPKELARNDAAARAELGRYLAQRLDASPEEKRLGLGLLAIELLREHGENPLALETMNKLKGLLPDEDFQKLQRRLTESIALEQNYQKKALSFLEKAAEDEKTPAEHRAILLYLCGELNRRLGQGKEARSWFEKARQHKEPEWIQKLTDRQMQLLGPEKPPASEKETK